MIEIMQLADFREATAYAKAAQGQMLCCACQSEEVDRLQHGALSDRMKPPIIHHIQRMDGRILVQVLPDDNVMVSKVEVQVLDEQGRLWNGEKGPGTTAIGGSTSPNWRGRRSSPPGREYYKRWFVIVYMAL